MSVTTIDIHEARTHWAELLGLVLGGDEVLVTQAQNPVIRLVPVSQDAEPTGMGQASQKIAGLHAGMGWMSDDFDAPLPDEFWSNEK